MRRSQPRREEPGLVAPGAFSALLRDLAAPPQSVESGPAPFRPGQVIGRFELVREIGRGGFGVVYEARDCELGRSVAFKALRVNAALDVREERLLREAEAAARLAHPNIVTLHDVGRCEAGPYLVLELLRGRTLADRIEHGALPPPEAVGIGVEVARGLAHAHAHGVVHRDLKPANVFLCNDGQVKVLDFGMAHAFGRPKVDGGTKPYMAPEQLRGAPEDERTDVFALGVLLYRTIAGRLPPLTNHPAKSRPVQALRELPGLGRLVSRMLAKDPVKRPRTAREALTALEQFAAMERPARPASGALLRPCRRRRVSSQPAAQPSIAVLPFVNLTGDPEHAYFTDGLSEEILNALAHVPGLRVTGRTSSFSFKGSREDLRTIGRRLGVGSVLEGSVRRSGSRARIAAQLVDTVDGLHLWAHTYDREADDVFAVQIEIAGAVAEALAAKLVPSVPFAPPPASTEAYREFLIGRHLLNRSSQEDIIAASAAFERAIALDPSFAAARAALAGAVISSTLLIGSNGDIDRRERRALDEADVAISLAPRLADGYSARGWTRLLLSRDWPGAKSDLEQALALKPGDAVATLRYGHLLAVTGSLEKGIAATLKATELDPLDPWGWALLGKYECARRAWAASQSAVRRALQLAPGHVVAEDLHARIHLFQEDAQEALRLASAANAEWVRLLGTALALHAVGRDGESQRALDALVSGFGRDAAAEIAQVHAWRRDLHGAFEWLERAFVQRDPGLRYLMLEPVFDPLRHDDRYATLLRKMKLPLDHWS